MRDRFGFRRSHVGSEYATGAGSAIGNDQTIVMMLWMRAHHGSTTGAYVEEWFLHETVADDHLGFFRLNNAIVFVNGRGGAYSPVTVPIPDSGDHLWCLVEDRLHARMDCYLDGIFVGTTGAASDPDFTTGANILLQIGHDAGGALSKYKDVTWRALALSMDWGDTATRDEFADWFRGMKDPHSPVHPDLLALEDDVYHDFYPGEGEHDDTDIEDVGTTGDDLTIQGGLTIRQIRERCLVPKAIPRRTWYSPQAGATATTGAHDFGVTGTTFMMRILLGDMHHIGASPTLMILDSGGGDMVKIYVWSGVQRIYTTNGGGNPSTMPAEGDMLRGGDLWIAKASSTVYYYWNGQYIHRHTQAGGPIDLSGNLTLTLDSDGGRISRVAVWSPDAIPATFLDEIRDCCMDPEADPPSLTAKRIDFPLHSGILTAAGSTDVANQGAGGGTLVLSAGRDTSCVETFHGMDP